MYDYRFKIHVGMWLVLYIVKLSITVIHPGHGRNKGRAEDPYRYEVQHNYYQLLTLRYKLIQLTHVR